MTSLKRNALRNAEMDTKVTVRYSTYLVSLTSSGRYAFVMVRVKGHFRKVFFGTPADLPKRGKAREALARAMFPAAQ